MNFTLSFQLYFSCKLSIKGNYSFYFILLVLLVNKLSYPIAISIFLRAVLLEYTFVSPTSHERIYIIYCCVHSHHHMVMLHLVCAINFIFIVNITQLCFKCDLFQWVKLMLLYLKMKILNKALLTPNLWLCSSVRSSTQLLSSWHGFNPFTPKIS